MVALAISIRINLRDFAVIKLLQAVHSIHNFLNVALGRPEVMRLIPCTRNISGNCQQQKL